MKDTYLAKRLHLDLTGEDAAEQLKRISQYLYDLNRMVRRDVPSGLTYVEVNVPDVELGRSETPQILTLANDCEYTTRTVEMLGAELYYRIAQFAPEHEVKDSALVADNLAKRLAHVGVQFKKRGKERRIVIPGRETEFTYDQYGTIQRATGPEIAKYNDLAQNLEGQDALHFLAAHVHQDLAVVMKKKDGLIYTFDCSMYEKTPKDVETGENKFLGRNLMDLTGKYEGIQFNYFLENLVGCFQQLRLDLLTVDHRGEHIYSNGEQEARRFERDYVTPIRRFRKFKGILAYADVFFQDPLVTENPFDGGEVLDHQVKFHKEYKPVRKAMEVD